MNIDTQTFNSIIRNKELLNDTTITKVEQLFPRIEEVLLEQPTIIVETPKEEKICKNKEIKKEEIAVNEDNLITIDQFFQTTLKIGTIIEAVEVEKSAKLSKLQVDLGEGRNRQLLAGIKEYYT